MAMPYFSENLTAEMSYRTFDDDTTSLSETDLPVRPENRRKTDKYFVIVFIIAVAILMPFLVYTLIHSDISRLIAGSAVDISKKDIEELYGPQQSSKLQTTNGISYDDSDLNVDEDKYDNPYSQHSGSVSWTTRKEHKFHFSAIGWRLAFVTFVSLGLCIILANLFRYATATTVWGILTSTLLVLTFYTIALWVNQTSVGASITLSIVTVLYFCMMIFLKEKIRLAIMLFKEATKATFQMHMIFAVPAAIVTLALVITVVFCITTVYMLSAGYYSADTHDYVYDGYMTTALILNSCITLWVSEFLIGVQYMIIGGAVTKWYFSRNKTNLGNPVFTSFYVTVKYHIGTVLFGSLIITLVTILRTVLRSLASHHRLRWLVMCFMDAIEGFLRFFTKNSYIVTAMHGTPFIKSGKQAVKLLTLNICNTITVTSIGDFVIGVSYFLVIFLSILTAILIEPDGAYKDDDKTLAYVFVIITSLFCCITILGTFETAFSTLFLCVCQDFLINNGEDKPYAMTRDLMEYLDTSKKMYAKKIQEKNLPTI